MPDETMKEPWQRQQEQEDRDYFWRHGVDRYDGISTPDELVERVTALMTKPTQSVSYRVVDAPSFHTVSRYVGDGWWEKTVYSEQGTKVYSYHSRGEEL